MAPVRRAWTRDHKKSVQQEQLSVSKGIEEQEYACTYAAEFRCNEVFDTQELASEHAIFEHAVIPFHKGENGRFKCPFVSSGCQFTGTEVVNIREHASSKHPGVRVPCPLSGFHCRPMGDIDNMCSHIWGDHKETRIPCPYLWIDDCDKTYGTREAASVHVRNMHQEKRYPCPFREKFECLEEFTSPKLAREHGQSHGHPCPLKDEFNCLKEYTTAERARRHAETHTGNFPCPRANDLKCSRTYRGKQAAQRHGETHNGTIYACPGAEEYECELLFTHKGTALSHFRRCHKRRFKCRHRGCHKRFETDQEASKHAKTEHQHHLFLCPFKDCQSRVAGIRYKKSYINTLHRDVHIQDGQLGSNDEFLSISVADLDQSSETQLYQLILQQEGLSTDDSSGENRHSDDNDNDGDGDGDDCLESEDHFFFESWEDTENERVSTNTEFSPKYRRRVETGNIARWTRFIQSTGGHVHTSAFRNLGLTCLGPMSTEKGLVLERCPYEIRLDFDTAKLRQSYNGRACLTLPNRCVSCESDVKLRSRLARLGWEFDGSVKICQHAACKKSTFHETRMCVKHMAKAVNQQKAGLEKLPEFQKIFSRIIENTWNLPSSIHRSLADIQADKTPGTALIVLDVEFSPASGQVWEVSMIEQVSGKVLLNTTIKYENGIDHGHQIASSSQYYEHMSHLKAKAVYSSRRESAIDQMDVHQVAIKLKEIGINQNSAFLTWHQAPTDLRLLRRFLESAGYTDVLPLDKNCVPLIPIFRPNFQEAKSFPLALEVLFPVMFPRHDLIGLNHQALVDCQQTRLVLQAAIELTKPAKERGKGWDPERITKNSQMSIRNWLTDTMVGASASIEIWK